MSNTVKAKPGKYAGQVIIGKRSGRIWATIVAGGLVMPGLGAISAQPAMAAESVSSHQFGSPVHVPGSSVAVPISESEFRQRANQEINYFLSRHISETLGQDLDPQIQRFFTHGRVERWCEDAVITVWIRAGFNPGAFQDMGSVKRLRDHLEQIGHLWSSSNRRLVPQTGDVVFFNGESHVMMVKKVITYHGKPTLVIAGGNDGARYRKRLIVDYHNNGEIAEFGSLFAPAHTPGRHAKPATKPKPMPRTKPTVAPSAAAQVQVAPLAMPVPEQAIQPVSPDSVPVVEQLSQPVPATVVARDAQLTPPPAPSDKVSFGLTPVTPGPSMPLVTSTVSPLSALADATPVTPSAALPAESGSASPGSSPAAAAIPTPDGTTPSPSDASAVAVLPVVVPAASNGQNLAQLADPAPTPAIVMETPGGNPSPPVPVLVVQPAPTPSPRVPNPRVGSGASLAEVMRQLPPSLSQKTIDVAHYCWRLHSYAKAAGDAYGFPPSLLLAANLTPEDLLLATAFEESHCRPGAIQPGGLGRGPWQMDLGQHPEYKGGLNTMANAMAAAKLLRNYIGHFEGLGLSPKKALRAGLDAYNAGVAGTKRCMREGHDPDFCTTNKHYGTHILDNAIRIHHVLVYLGLED